MRFLVFVMPSLLVMQLAFSAQPRSYYPNFCKQIVQHFYAPDHACMSCVQIKNERCITYGAALIVASFAIDYGYPVVGIPLLVASTCGMVGNGIRKVCFAYCKRLG